MHAKCFGSIQLIVRILRTIVIVIFIKMYFEMLVLNMCRCCFSQAILYLLRIYYIFILGNIYLHYTL